MVLIVFAAHSQKIDTTCIPNAQLQKKLVQLEQCKVTRLELQQKKQELTRLDELVNIKDRIIQGLSTNTDILQAQIDNYEWLTINYEKQNEVSNQAIVNLQRQLKKQKRKTFFTGTGALLVIGSLTYLFIIK